MPRDFYEATLGAPDLAGNYKIFSGIRVSVFLRGTTTPVNIYPRETGITLGPSPEAGATAGPNPFITGPTGSVQFWADLGRCDILVEDTVAPPRIAPRTIQWNAKAMDEIPGTSLADLAVGSAKLADLAVGAGKLADLAVGTGKVADLAITTPKLIDLGVTTAKIGAKQVTAPKVEDQQAWQTMTLLTPQGGAWTGSGALSYYKDSLGLVHFEYAGSISVRTTGALGTLPAGYRPRINHWFPCAYWDSGTPAYGIVVMKVYAGGQFEPVLGGAPQGLPPSVTLDFGSIRYRAEN